MFQQIYFKVISSAGISNALISKSLIECLVESVSPGLGVVGDFVTTSNTAPEFQDQKCIL